MHGNVVVDIKSMIQCSTLLMYRASQRNMPVAQRYGLRVWHPKCTPSTTIGGCNLGASIFHWIFMKLGLNNQRMIWFGHFDQVQLKFNENRWSFFTCITYLWATDKFRWNTLYDIVYCCYMRIWVNSGPSSQIQTLGYS